MSLTAASKGQKRSAPDAPDVLRSAASAGQGGSDAPTTSAARVTKAIDKGESHKIRKCAKCGTDDVWRMMKSKRVVEFTNPGAYARAGTVGEKEDVKDGSQRNAYTHTCVECHSKKMGCCLAEATKDIRGERCKKNQARAMSFDLARGNVQEEFQFLGVDLSKIGESNDQQDAAPNVEKMSNTQKKKEMRRRIKMKMETLKEFFGSIIHLIELKSQDMAAASKANKRLKAWLESKPGEGKDFDAWEEEGAENEAELLEAATFKQRSFKGYKDPKGMLRAADYEDGWFNNDGSQFRSYYVCMGGGKENPCGTLILSDKWDTLLEDPLAEKQRWYCMCNKRYQPKFGVLVEIVHRMGPEKAETACYALAEHPPFNLKDLKAMAIQEQFQNLKTPQELYKALPKAKPLDRGTFLKPVAEMEGFYKFDVPMFKSIPEFQWNQLFNLPETKKQKKDREFAEGAESEAKKDVPETKNEWSAMECMEC